MRHPPVIHAFQQRLADWTHCTLEVRCPTPGCTRGSSHPPVRMLFERHGNLLFSELLGRLRCPKCHRPPAPVYLVAGHYRKFCGGGPPDWSLELVPEPNR